MEWVILFICGLILIFLLVFTKELFNKFNEMHNDLHSVFKVLKHVEDIVIDTDKRTIEINARSTMTGNKVTAILHNITRNKKAKSSSKIN